MKGITRLAIAALVLLALIPQHARAAFSEGPYGTLPHQIAGPFVAPTLDGDFDFRAAWNDLDSYVFIVDIRGSTAAEQLRVSSKLSLLQNSPSNVHYLICSNALAAATARTNVTAYKSSIDSAIAQLTPDMQEHWRTHIHYVTTPIQNLSGWPGEAFRRYGGGTPGQGPHALMIDRFQRLRLPGYLSYLGNPGPPQQLAFLTNEVRYFNYEWQLQQRLDGDGALVVPLFNNDATAGTRYSGTVMLPDSATMAGFDKMEIELSLTCTNHLDNSCFEWDYLANMYLCDESDTTKCDQEIGRWVTAYHREGRWVTDATPFMALLRSGGSRHFRFVTQDRWITNAAIRLSRTGRGLVPFQMMPLWTGGAYDRDYNAMKEPITFTMPEGAVAAEVVAVISGHGWGAEVANCAEFCDHTHHFTVNSREFVKRHPMAGTQNGCLEQIEQGVSPNQYGTWYLGRGGWCPGLDVKPFVADVTAALVPGENTISYRSLVDGIPYVPQSSGSGQGFGARLDMNSWLVFYRPGAPSAVNDPLDPSTPLVMLGQNYPNPFNTTTTVHYRVPRAGHVLLSVTDAVGNRVATVIDATMEPGAYTTQFDGSSLPRGVYYLRIETGGTSWSTKVVLAD